jgi:hypothetical protein
MSNRRACGQAFGYIEIQMPGGRNETAGTNDNESRLASPIEPAQESGEGRCGSSLKSVRGKKRATFAGTA